MFFQFLPFWTPIGPILESYWTPIRLVIMERFENANNLPTLGRVAAPLRQERCKEVAISRDHVSRDRDLAQN